ncbi:MAG: SIS domain-containing protein [Actinomycetota bacterium]|nr:SIS domain-containing protein [Actinomycetota bacterium]
MITTAARLDVAVLCRQMAERFARGGRLIAFGAGEADASDVRHVAVEFVHPVIVGKRALPALGVPASAVPLLAGPDDIVMAFGAVPFPAGLPAEALTIAFATEGDDPFAAQEVNETTYHVLWELVHVFFEHRGLVSGRSHDTGASSFLYPFLAEPEVDVEAVLADVRASADAKFAEAAELRAQTLAEAEATLDAAASGLRSCGKLLALGNGGSATDAMDAAADLRMPPSGLPPLPAIDLSADPAILTAVANDVGVDAMFSRQVIAYGEAGDGLLAFTTSGNSTNVIAALEEARRRGLVTVAFVGYDGGRILAERLADHVVVVRSQHIPRIQEAQASAWHALRRRLV